MSKNVTYGPSPCVDMLLSCVSGHFVHVFLVRSDFIFPKRILPPTVSNCLPEK